MLKKFKDYFQDKKVLITGNTGFKGSWLSQILLNLESNVIGFSSEIPTKPSIFEILELENNINHFYGDIRNFNSLNELIQNSNPDIIIHLAAQPLVRQSYIEPVETYQTNVIGTVNLLESVRKLTNYEHKRNSDSTVLLNVTTDKCYENKEINYAYKESDKLGGYDPYSSSKACSEIVTSAYRRSFFNTGDNNNNNNNNSNQSVAIATARAGNVIGGGDWSKDRLVVDCINALYSNEVITLRNPNALRPWQHVLDGLNGYLTLITNMSKQIDNDSNKNDLSSVDFNSSWNFGPYDENIVNVELLVKTLIFHWGFGDYKVESDDKFHEAILLKLDISKALKYLNWKPLLNFNDSIKLTVDWYKEYYINNGDMIKFTNNQIFNYFKH
ncbi:CDP-glucose 4,6-dehydratase [Methanobrevibacter curvatus]|uniref:CDP-glucose 4,6-dehydratase n=1 Tax=Methanobrevibacter curvatus TaxID=49547 RepID=A0A162FKJ9_9EURY|nr:CDP-glucose 4,6-dehydratase [Methanobrevibacter curvatus]KZX11410.1 CDP-glucose 4,6-dehydratase [Methanobrevibacter curvatus]